jgi:hypothetical protein
MTGWRRTLPRPPPRSIHSNDATTGAGAHLVSMGTEKEISREGVRQPAWAVMARPFGASRRALPED